MSKKLEDLFNLPPLSENEDGTEVQVDIQESTEMIRSLDDAIDKIDEALPAVRDLVASDKEMDELANLATTHFENLMELGMSVDSRFSGTIFQTASTLLGHAITAKQSKLDKKLRMVDLQLKKHALDMRQRQIDARAKQNGDPTEGAIEADGIVLDRNAILHEILKKKN